MKRTTPLRSGPKRPDFGVTPNDVLLFRCSRRSRDWLMGSVLSIFRTEVVMETADLAQHRVPLDARHLRVPDVAQVQGYQLDSEMARHQRVMALPSLSGPLLVRTHGAPRAVGPKRRKRYRSGEYLQHVREQPPIGGGRGLVEAHHVNEQALGGDRGVSQKTDDYDTVPLTESAHAHLTQHRRLPGMSRAATERAILLGKLAALKAWIVKHEEPTAEAAPARPGPDPEAAYLDALDGLPLAAAGGRR